MRYRLSWLSVVLVTLGAGPTWAQTRIITGRVADSVTTQPVVSGQVAVQGATTGTSIKDDGTFTLAVPARDAILMFRSIGYKRKDVTVPAGQNSVQVSLARDYFQLEAIVVTGQATGVERKNLANAVATVSAEQLLQTPAQSVEHALTGKLSGANITTTSGAPGGGNVVQLRGTTSIIGKFTPLYVVDGVIVSDVSIPAGTNLLSRSFGNGLGIAGIQDNPVNRIADLNPNDIENIEVLKGAAASAIYGSKASNGVVLITTKRGRVGAPQFNVSQRFGISAASKLPGFRAFPSVAEGVAWFGSQATNYCCTAFDNEGEAYGHKPLSYETDASMSGGTESTRYFASGLVKHDGGIMGHTFSDKQSLRINVDQNIGQKLSFSIGSEFLHTLSDRGLTNNENNSSSVMAGLIYGPSFFDMRRPCDKKGDPLYKQCDGPGGVFPRDPFINSNPLQTLELLKNREGVWRILGSAKMQWDVLTGARHTLKVLANGGGDIFTQDNQVFSPPELFFEPLDGLIGTSVQSFSLSQNYNINGNLVHTYKSPGVTLTSQVGVQYEAANLNTNRSLTQNLIGGLRNVSNGTANILEQYRERVRDMGLFAQEEFLTLNERLLLTIGGRADQSSNNADAKKLYFFPKGSASFRAVTSGGGFLNELKLRGAFGYSGNQPVYGQKFTELAAGNINGLPTLSFAAFPAILGAVDLKPERQREIEAGIDATLFGSKATFEATVYEKRITDLLLTRTLPATVGFDQQIFNGGSMRTRGLELGLTAYPIRSSGVQWNTRGTFFMSRCKILAMDVPAYHPATFLNSEFFMGSTFVEPGASCTQITGVDTLPDGSSAVRKVRDANPDYKVSWTNDVTVKAVKFYFLWDYLHGGAMANVTQFEQDISGTAPDQEIPRKAGEANGNERLAALGRSVMPWLYAQTYLKLREATFSVDLPPSFVRKVWTGARYLRFSLSGRNLLMFTHYPTGDPEVVQEARSTVQEVPWDIWAYPPSRSFWASISVGF